MRKIFVRLVLGGLVGKALGLLRETLLAALFGAGRAVAASRVALTATLVPVNFFTADALSAGFLPLYIQYRKERSPAALALYRAVRLLLAALSLALALVLLLGADRWVRLLAPGLDAGTSHVAAAMLRIAGLGVPFYIQYSLDALVALAHDDVRLVNLRASGQSIGFIGATLAAYLRADAALLAWGFTVPYAVLWGWGAFRVRRRGYLRDERPSAGPPADPPAGVAEGATAEGGHCRGSHRRGGHRRGGHYRGCHCRGGRCRGGHRRGAVRRMAVAMFWRRLRPLLFVPLILQGSIAVERIVGSLLGVEVVAATEYSRFVVDSCMALLAAPLGLAGLASFAKMEPDEVAAGLRRLVPPVLLVSIPLALILSIDSSGVVELLYRRGRFDDHAARTTSVMLTGFALGIWAQVLGYTLVKVLNARGANARVAVITALSFSAALVLNLSLYRYWGAFTLGAAASFGGLVLLVASAGSLAVLGFVLRSLAALLPGVVIAGSAGYYLAGAAGYYLAGPGPARLAVSCVAIVGLWCGYVAAVPRLRRDYLSAVWPKARALPGPLSRGRAAPPRRSAAPL